MKIKPWRFIKRLYPDFIWEIDDSNGIFLTFDDGPTPGVTEWILATLRRYDAKATFFVLGKNAELYPDLYQRILDEYLAHCKEPNWIAATYFQYHPDIQISQVAVEMLADKYQLSRMYSRQTVSENVVKEVVPSASDNLPELITRLLLELKLTIVEEKEKIAQEMLTEASKHQDFQLIKTIIEQQQQLLQIKQQLKKLLGRVF